MHSYRCRLNIWLWIYLRGRTFILCLSIYLSIREDFYFVLSYLSMREDFYFVWRCQSLLFRSLITYVAVLTLLPVGDGFILYLTHDGKLRMI